MRAGELVVAALPPAALVDVLAVAALLTSQILKVASPPHEQRIWPAVGDQAQQLTSLVWPRSSHSKLELKGPMSIFSFLTWSRSKFDICGCVMSRAHAHDDILNYVIWQMLNLVCVRTCTATV